MTIGRLITAGLILLLAAGPVVATPFHHPPMLIAQRDHADKSSITLDEAVAQARKNNKGKVLSAETVRVNGRKIYRIKILTKNGRVKRTQIDARSGQPMSRGH